MKSSKNYNSIIGISLLFLEISLLAILFSVTPESVLAGIGTPNGTPLTRLNVGNSFPEVLNVSIEEDIASITLIPNSTKILSCVAVIVDYNGESDIEAINATFYHTPTSTHEAANDNNDHYTNSSCNVTNSFGTYNGFVDDGDHILANCTYLVEYYANPNEWYCNVTVNDSSGSTSSGFGSTDIADLLSIGLPDSIQYGLINATTISGENISNVTNFGNVELNLSLEGYGFTEGDGNAMNCTLGATGNISVEHEKYNLTAPNSGTLTLGQVEANYTNLTTIPIIRDFNLTRRTNDTENKAIQQTYWRIYVPTGVAGTCEGFIKFGATTANAA